MAYSTVPKTRRDGKITLQDGTSGIPVTLEVAYENGDFSFSQPQKYAETVIMDRTNITTVRYGDEQVVTGSFTFHFRQFTDAVNAGSVRDFVTKSGAYSSNVSTGLSGVPYVEHFCVDIALDIEGTNFGDDQDAQAILEKCVCSLDFSEGDPNGYTLNFTCYGGVTYA